MEKFQETRFEFGKNWQSYVDSIVDQPQIILAKQSLCRLLDVEDLSGRTFLDIGCGSGLFSLAAVLLGAHRVVSFDYDINSVKASQALRSKMNIPEEKWEIMQGSILDATFLSRLEPVDVVYSWGVLHHTGDMWQAIDNATRLAKPDGLFSIAIYNDVQKRVGGSKMWWHIKRIYNHVPTPVRRMMEAFYIGNRSLRMLLTLRNPIRHIQNYGQNNSRRGMDYLHDVRDWLGGYPYEYATAGTIFNYVHETFDWQLQYLNTRDGHICNEFTFRCSPSRN